MPVSQAIKNSMSTSSWIRKMFEEGAKLKARFGAENVFDFSIGNPDVDPPELFFQNLKELALSTEKGIHGYMPNAGFPGVRRAIAEKVGKENKLPLTDEHIIMTCGAAGGLNVIFKTILDPGDQVIVPTPYFVE